MQSQKRVKTLEKMVRYGNRADRDNDNYYILRMIINKSFRYCIQFFKFDIHYIDKNSIEKNVYHIFQNMEKHGQNLKIMSWGYGVCGIQSP